MTAPFPVPYVRYGDYLNWPVYCASDVSRLEDSDYRERLSWTFVKNNGMDLDPGRSRHYIGYFNPDSQKIFKQLDINKLAANDYWSRLDELYRPWCTEMLKPLDEFMTKLSKRWQKGS